MGLPGGDPVALLLQRLLDRGYTQATGAVINAIVGNSLTGVMALRLDQLDAEAARLAAEGKKMTANNPVAAAVLAEFESIMAQNGALLGNITGAIQASGVNAAGPLTRALTLGGLTDQMLAGLGVAWNTPNPDAIASVVNMLGNPAFAEKLQQYVNGTSQTAKNVFLKSIVSGQGPLALSRDLRAVIEGLPVSWANHLGRSLQLTAMRDAQVAHRMANAHIIEHHIWYATLDGRVCMSCIGLHGTRLGLDERVNDHHQGRCTSVTKVRGFAAPDIVSGPDWFDRLPRDQKLVLAGPSKLAALEAGAISWPDLSQPYSDPVYGAMIHEASLIGILGSAAEEFYQ